MRYAYEVRLTRRHQVKTEVSLYSSHAKATKAIRAMGMGKQTYVTASIERWAGKDEYEYAILERRSVL